MSFREFLVPSLIVKLTQVTFVTFLFSHWHIDLCGV